MVASPGLFGFTWWVILSYVVIALAGILIGVALALKFVDKKHIVRVRQARNVIALLITLVWSLSILADIFLHTYSTSVLVNAIMGAAVGYIFGEDGWSVRKLISLATKKDNGQ